MTPLAHILALPVRAYRLLLSPWVGHGCRFQPTCSTYAMEALALHGGIRGGWLTARRLCRCHPWGAHGFDPVPGTEPPADPGCTTTSPPRARPPRN
ncbi:membrane protein insertion efficiency factor YidD [Szabonella alba]|uniref:Putative membrane protein insertion efficiency factor n=1 Tax=Szabonella alba TaxID=2804194 RepID=A0A8K0VFD4_9RHOB|nr:membrane protein insertion efficiency factor YidD [Szabonella alba]MBL4918770.1 membrane protein insertion efficiency factor YidD [Szabonella alba]